MLADSVRFSNGVAELFLSGDYSDLIVICEEDTYKVHKAILCSQCDFFKNACSGRFQESETNVIDLTKEDVDPRAVRAMLQYLYTRNYDTQCATTDVTAEPIEPAMFHVLVFAVGEKYLLPGLKALAKDKFENIVSSTSWTEYDFPAVVTAIYDTTPASVKDLRTIVISITISHRADLLKNPAFLEMMDRQGAFGKDLFKSMRDWLPPASARASVSTNSLYNLTSSSPIQNSSSYFGLNSNQSTGQRTRHQFNTIGTT